DPPLAPPRVARHRGLVDVRRGPRGRARGGPGGVEGRAAADHRVVREVRREPPGRALDRARRAPGPVGRLSLRTTRSSTHRTTPTAPDGVVRYTSREPGHPGHVVHNSGREGGDGHRCPAVATAPRTGTCCSRPLPASTRTRWRTAPCVPTTRGWPR